MDTKQQEQIEKWNRLYGHQISENEYTELCTNLNGFFTILKEWDNEERTRLENERTCSVGNSNHTG
jgi:chemotaxis regulatin CheY-phosphate phosphatase CheZ